MAGTVFVNGGSSETVDLSHHINLKSRSRHPSPLKDIIKFMGYEGMISLAGGLPHPSLFPIHDLALSVSSPSTGEDVARLEVSNETSGTKLSQWLQYGNGAGAPALREWCRDFTEQVHQPANKNFEILCHPGNTNAWSKVVGLLLEEGDYILCEEFTYPSSQALWIPLGNFAAPVALDAEGMRADLLRKVLEEWDLHHPNTRRPHVLYIVPVGSNPSGVTYSAQRKQEIYAICVEYDIILVEDDPYYFLQFPPFDLEKNGPDEEIASNDGFLKSLSPSFLRYDHQGRVIRLESFSKTLAPGLRLGYFITNPIFTERLLRASEVETQDPSGLSQAVTLSLLQSWGTDGYITWLKNLRTKYEVRCGWMIAAFGQHFDLVPASKYPDLQAEGVVAVLKAADGSKATPVFSFVPPTGGMFIWTRFYLQSNPAFKTLLEAGTYDDPEQTFTDQLWALLAEEKVLLTPGSYYHPWQGRDSTTTKARGADSAVTNFRFAFSMVTKEEVEMGIQRLAKVLRKSWHIL
ncbi:aromatic aminotransferase Aro8 [Thozetella sp. PMI_491]|nr:aromatic aminotransferase Aro8 [Thozetella sp. PMI_491]